MHSIILKVSGCHWESLSLTHPSNTDDEQLVFKGLLCLSPAVRNGRTSRWRPSDYLKNKSFLLHFSRSYPYSWVYTEAWQTVSINCCYTAP